MRRCATLALCFALFAAACGTAADDPIPALPTGFDGDQLVDGGAKADSITKWWTTVQGELAYDSGVAGETDPWEFHGYTFELALGDSVVGKAEGDDYGYFALYGPQKPNGKWGQPRVWDFITWNSALGQYTTKLDELVADADGTYMLVVGSPWAWGPYGYSLSLTCTSDTCGGAPEAYCVEWEAAAPDGTSLNEFHAVNVSTYEGGKALLAQIEHFFHEDIRPGTCASQPNDTPRCGPEDDDPARCWAPICAGLPDEYRITWANVEAFKVHVRQAAGDEGEAYGAWDDGECRYCVEWEVTDDAGAPLQRYYAANVHTYEDGKALLAAFGNFTSEDILYGACETHDQGVLSPNFPKVCGGLVGEEPQEFLNLTWLKVHVRAAAGFDGKAEGLWEWGACPAPPAGFCVEFETTDPDGNPLQNFYAVNAATEEEAKDILGSEPFVINSAVHAGACVEQSQIVPLYWAPVCGELDGTYDTYGNVPSFKVAVRQAAGWTGEAKGHWELGACE